jgi:hypothetical protein
MPLEVEDFVARADGVAPEDVPPRVRERVNDALATLTGGEGGPDPTPPEGLPADLVVSAARGVAGGEPYATIEGGLAAAGEGDVVFVEPGTYGGDGPVSVSTPDVTLVSTEGPSGATVEAQVLAEADGVTVDGFDVSPPPATGNQNGEALRIAGGASDVTVRNNLVRDFSEEGVPEYEGIGGIVAFGGDGTDPVENVRILDNEVTRIEGRTTRGGASGISVQGAVDGAVVKGNTISEIGLGNTTYCFGVVVRGSGNDGTGAPRSVEIVENDVGGIASTDTGADDDLFGVGIENEADASEIAANFNNVTDVELLAENKDTEETLDATRNWWGEGGPDLDRVLNSTERSVAGRGPVDTSPYLDAPFDEGGAPVE